MNSTRIEDSIQNSNDMFVEQKIKTACDLLLKNDLHLFEVNAHERSFTHRLACYLEDLFPEYNVDCEYNRNIDMVKVLPYDMILAIGNDEQKERSVYPDIIVHRRGTNDNFIVIEAKKSNHSGGDAGKCSDIEKLRVYKEHLGYTHAFFVEFVLKERCCIIKPM